MEGKGLATANGGTGIQPYTNGIIILMTDKPQSCPIVYDNAMKAKARR